MAPIWPETSRPSGTLLELLTLEELDRDLYRATTVFDEPHPIYGGQVAAQALLAAGGTVPSDRAPHSLHGYFLRGGDTRRDTIFRVDRDRDGRSFSARRVVAVQNGEVILNMSVSFHIQEKGLDLPVDAIPELEAPETLERGRIPRLASFEGAVPTQDHDGLEIPTRFWARCTERLPDDPLMHAAVLTYVSDTSSGLAGFHQDGWWTSSSLDHSMWFHRHIRLDDWVLVDLAPRTVSGGRGLYTGSMYSREGVLGASLTQEALFRKVGPPGI
ncbi:MAG TPA: acyl-CoA thioesterase domain-containing protein [Pseudonocardia sp.]|jgi:acyl-CoA thioesterase-2|nr:acyl-CoA thioesterase domain-containing protein [Pseudonocardia sp.]